jgi:MarR family transcriptional regulator, lower aerobic nicotinate degradation pathway regulator
MSIAFLAAKPGHLIRRAQQIHNALFAEECGRFDLTSVQYGALVAVRESPGIDATRLSMVIAFDRSTLGDVLERLESKGWLRRQPSPADKRVKLLYLTEPGVTLLRQVDPLATRVQDRILAPLCEADRTTLLGLLDRLVDLHQDQARTSLAAIVSE